MNKDDIIKSRLLFEIARKKAEQNINQENLVVKATSNSASKCKSARSDFAYERGMTELEIDKEMLNRHGKLNSNLLTKSVKNVAARRRVNTAGLSI